MAQIKLPRLPDRTPVKLTIMLTPELHAALDEYAEFYGETYGGKEPLGELAAAVLASFLESDRAFQARRRSRQPASP